MNFLLLLLVTIVATDALPRTRNPGMKLKASENGLNYAIKVVVDELSTYLRTKTIPDISGGTGQVSYSASNILVKDIKSSGSSVTAVSRKGLTITLPNVAITITGNWSYQWIWSYINIRDSGSFTASATDVTFRLLFDLGYDSNGRPTMWTRSNVTQIGDVNVIFHGGSATIYNTFRGYVEGITRRLIYTTFNDALEDSINDWARNNLRNLDMRAPVKGVATLDYRLVSAPYIGNGYVQSLHRGEFFGINSNMEAPFLPSPMEDFPVTSKMVAICVSDYVINSLGYVIYRHGYLTYTVALTEADLPPSIRDLLKFASYSPMNPAAPAETITLLMTATGRPNLSTDKNGIKLYLPGIIVIKARQSTGQLATLMTLAARAEIDVIVEMTEEKITARVENFRLKTDVTSPSINSLMAFQINTMMKAAVDYYVIPKLNDIGREGYMLPFVDYVKYVNRELHLLQETLCVVTDLKYSTE